MKASYLAESFVIYQIMSVLVSKRSAIGSRGTFAITRQIKLTIVIVKQHGTPLIYRRWAHIRLLLHLKIVMISVTSHLVNVNIYQDIIPRTILN